jgi:hypothetical protein
MAAEGSGGGVAVRSLCRLGGLRVGAERGDLDVELMRSNMSHTARLLLEALLAEPLAPADARGLEAAE